MQRPPSFVLLDSETDSSSENDDIVELAFDASRESENLTVDVPLNFDESLIKAKSENEALFFSESIGQSPPKHRDLCLTSTDGCEDVEYISPPLTHSSDTCPSHSDDVQSEPTQTVTTSESEVIPDKSSRAEDDNAIMEGGVTVDYERHMDAVPTSSNGVPLTNLFEFWGVTAKFREVISNMESTSKLFALCLLVAILIPSTRICLSSISKSTTESDFTLPSPVSSDGSSELAKCRSTLNWRQEKVEQMEIKLDSLKSSLNELQKSYGECTRSLSEYQEKYKGCRTSLKETKKQLKARDELYEESRNKVLQLQEQIINSQQDDSLDRRPFYQKAFDKIFGYHSDRKFRQRRNRWRN